MENNTFEKLHISYYVQDIVKTETFYTRFFNHKPAKSKPGYLKYELEDPGLVISFIENENRVHANFGHLGFRVREKEALDYYRNQMEARQLISSEEIGTNCCYARQDKFWVTDPDGYEWEIYYVHEDVEFNDPHSGTDKDQVCCSDTLELTESAEKEQEVSCSPAGGCC